MGKRLRRRGIVPDLVLSSPARRAATTARLLTQELGLPSDCVHFEKALYDADISTLYDLVYTLPPDYDHVAIVGHNPTVHWFCLDLTHAPIQTFVTCAVADIALAVPDWSVVSPGTGRLLEFLTPKDPPDPDAG